jgi:hypothetical protein
MLKRSMVIHWSWSAHIGVFESGQPAQPRLVTPGLKAIDASGPAEPQLRCVATIVNFRH